MCERGRAGRTVVTLKMRLYAKDAACSLAYASIFLPRTVHAGFDWGSGCSAGTGQPFTTTLAEGDTAVIGSIPEGKYNVKIYLGSATDVDVQLVDEVRGEPIIAWCEKKHASDRAEQIRNGCGLLPTTGDVASAESVTYKGMSITYSGYGRQCCWTKASPIWKESFEK